MSKTPAYDLHPFKRLFWLDAGLSLEQTADWCGVTPRVVLRWLAGGDAPAHAYHLMHYRTGRFLDPAWAGWYVQDGRLWSPEGIPHRPGEVRALPYLAELAKMEQAPGRQFDLFSPRG